MRLVSDAWNGEIGHGCEVEKVRLSEVVLEKRDVNQN
jgi:hypothetical protein